MKERLRSGIGILRSPTAASGFFFWGSSQPLLRLFLVPHSSPWLALPSGHQPRVRNFNAGRKETLSSSSLLAWGRSWSCIFLLPPECGGQKRGKLVFCFSRRNSAAESVRHSVAFTPTYYNRPTHFSVAEIQKLSNVYFQPCEKSRAPKSAGTPRCLLPIPRYLIVAANPRSRFACFTQPPFALH